MTCIKTGAVVYFREYGFVSRADLYEVNGSTIVRWNVEGKHFCNEVDSNCTYVLSIPTAVQLIGDIWHRDDLGVTVVPNYCMTRYREYGLTEPK